MSEHELGKCSKEQLQSKLARYQQVHLLRFWDELDRSSQSELAEQIASIDFELIARLYNQRDSQTRWEELAARAELPSAITLDEFNQSESLARAVRIGEEALRQGKVAVILTAGGQGSRLGVDCPKGVLPVGPVSGRSLFQIIIEHAMARGRQFDARIPLYIMTSPPTHDQSERFLMDRDFFGYDRRDIKLFCQGVMPAIDHNGKVLLADKGRVFFSPDGHGGALAALEKSGYLADILNRSVEHVFYCQIDNPLVQVCHPALIGYHIASESEMTTQVVRKSDPLQKVGNVVSIDGRVQIIEYSDLPERIARQTNADGSLKLWAGSIAVHVFAAEFLRRTSHNSQTLPYHRADKIVPHIDSSGTRVQPQEMNAIKFERFIFDLLPHANKALVCEVDPAEGFCAVKNSPPAASETVEHAQRAMISLHTKWLTSAGVQVTKDIPVEINPLFAVDAHQLAERNGLPRSISTPCYLA
jgi:UDP-N-acetylglucosamine/UDP-N-acetylgalactosamine diphosphorylase